VTLRNVNVDGLVSNPSSDEKQWSVVAVVNESFAEGLVNVSIVLTDFAENTKTVTSASVSGSVTIGMYLCAICMLLVCVYGADLGDCLLNIISLVELIIDLYHSSDLTPPNITGTFLTSTDDGNTNYATEGDVITLSFNSSEKLVTPWVQLAGRNASVSDISSGAGTRWEASITVQSDDPQGNVTVSVVFEDLAENAGTTLTSVSEFVTIGMFYFLPIIIELNP